MNYVNVFINDIPYKVRPDISVLEVCNQKGFEVSRFCFHEKLFVAGNCRMCLVEIVSQPKLAASCAIFFSNGMSIYTNSPVVKKARESVLEFLLINHPLDCPICDQGGECDLQDQSFFYGSDKSRFFEYKRAVSNKNCGPLIKTVMNRCIQCTRCVRFSNDVVGFSDFGSVGRGNLLEISLYVKKLMSSELSGNIIDICPVGALTSKPNSFSIRPWEIKSVRSIDVFDSFGSNIRVDSRNLEVLRILPYKNDFVNEEWISDKIRFGHDCLKRQRLSKPFFRFSANFFGLSWSEMIEILNDKFQSLNKTKFVLDLCVGPFCDLKTGYAIKNFLKICLKSSCVINFDNLGLKNLDFQHFFCFNNKFQILESPKIDSCFLIGVDPKKEAPILNLRLRKRFIKDKLLVVNVGSRLSLTIPVIQLSINSFQFINFLSGNVDPCKTFKKIRLMVVLVGNCFLSFSKEIVNRFLLVKLLINLKTTGLNFVSTRSSDVSLYHLGLKTKKVKKSRIPKFLFVLGDGIFKKYSEQTFVCLQGTQGNESLLSCDLILPSLSFLEKSSIHINMEGRFQNSQKSITGPKNSREDFDILISLLRSFNYEFYEKLKTNFLLRQNKIPFDKSDNNSFFRKFCWPIYVTQIKIKNYGFVCTFNQNFYQSSSILKNSAIMAQSSKTLLVKSPF